MLLNQCILRDGVYGGGGLQTSVAFHSKPITHRLPHHMRFALRIQLTEVVGDNQETLERLLRFPDEVNEVLQYPHQQSSAGSDLQFNVRG